MTPHKSNRHCSFINRHEQVVLFKHLLLVGCSDCRMQHSEYERGCQQKCPGKEPGALPQAFAGHPRGSHLRQSRREETGLDYQAGFLEFKSVVVNFQPSMPPKKKGKPKKQHKKPPAKAIALGRGKRSVSPKRKSASPERKTGEKSPSKTAAGRDAAVKKVAKAKSVSFVSSDDDDEPQSGELETRKGARSYEKDMEIPRKKVPNSDTDDDMTVAGDDDTDEAGSGDVMALGSTELTTYFLNKHPDRAADSMQPSRAALWLWQALSLRGNPEAHEELKVSKETLSTMKVQVGSASAPRVLYVMDCPRGNADYAIMLSTLLSDCREELAFPEGVLPEAAEYVLREMLHAYSTGGPTVEPARDKSGEDSPSGNMSKLVESQAKMVELLAKRDADKVSQFTVVELTKAQNECMRLGYDCCNSNVPYFTQITLAVKCVQNFDVASNSYKPQRLGRGPGLHIVLAHGANPFCAYSGGHAVLGLCGGCSRNVREAVQSQPLLQSASVDSCWQPFDRRGPGWSFGTVDGVRTREDKSSRH